MNNEHNDSADYILGITSVYREKNIPMIALQI